MNCASLLVRRIKTVPWPRFDMNYWGLHEIWKCFGQWAILETDILTRSACELELKSGGTTAWAFTGQWILAPEVTETHCRVRCPSWVYGRGFVLPGVWWLSYYTFQNPLPLRVRLPVIHVGCSRQLLDRLLWDFTVTWDFSQRTEIRTNFLWWGMGSVSTDAQDLTPIWEMHPLIFGC